MITDVEQLRAKGMSKLSDGDILAAMVYFEKAVNSGGTPDCISCFGYCIAKERGQASKGLTFCRDALEREPDNPLHYLNMARIQLLMRNQNEALDLLRQGAACGHDDTILALIEEIGTRKPPVLSFLHRDHPVNKYLGMILGRLGIR